MPAVKLTKNELKRQKDALKRFRRYLPTLILKKQQLQMVIRQLENRLDEETQNREGLFDGMASWLDLFAESFPFHDWLKVKSVQTESANVAGVEIPVFKSIDFTTAGHDLFMTPPWVDEALFLFARLSRLDVEIGLLRRQIGLLANRIAGDQPAGEPFREGQDPPGDRKHPQDPYLPRRPADRRGGPRQDSQEEPAAQDGDGMIVLMKKATVIARREETQDCLRKLRRLGVLHLSAVPVHVLPAQEWREKKILLEKALAVIAPPSSRGLRGPPRGRSKAATWKPPWPRPGPSWKNRKPSASCTMMSGNLKKETLHLRDWEGVSASDLQAIRDGGYEVRFFEVPPKQLGLDSARTEAFRHPAYPDAALGRPGPESGHPDRAGIQAAASRPGAARPSWRSFRPRTALTCERLRLELDALGAEAEDLGRAVQAADREIELAEATAAMGHTEALSYLSGFLPPTWCPS